MKNIIYKKDGILVDDTFIALNEIIKQCNKQKIEEDNLVLLKMNWSGRRGFDGIEEKILLSKDKIDIVKKYIVGKTIYFGEIAGKHSDIYGILEEKEIEVIEDKDIITKFMNDNPNGHEYNHSFLHTFLDYANDGGYDDISTEDIDEIEKIFE